MSNAGTNSNRNSAVNDDLDRASNKASEAVNAASDAAEDAYDEGVSEVRSALARLEDEITDLYDIVAERSADSIDAIEEAVQAYPWYSLGVAFLAGCVTTLILGRRN